MEPSSPPPRRGRSNVLFAIIAIALLLVGIGAGYVLGRPAPTSMPGAVNNLARPSTIPRVDGWFRNASVSYLDFGPQANVALPILVFFRASSPSSPVAGQRNTIDTIPGQPGYSDLWHVMKVVVDMSYVANSLKDARSILAARDAGQLTIDPTTIYVNCPVVS